MSSLFIMQIVKNKDPDYFLALQEGKQLRAIVDWLTKSDSDFGLQRMKHWMNHELGSV